VRDPIVPCPRSRLVRLLALTGLVALGSASACGGAPPLEDRPELGDTEVGDTEVGDSAEERTPRTYRLAGARDLTGAPLELEIREGTIVAAGTLGSDVEVRDVHGAYVVPAFVDAHVHFSYWSVADEHRRGGIAVALDLAAPEETLAQDPASAPLLVLRSGPMITAEGGYPLDSWGRDGYGTECHDPPSCRARAEALIAAGADVLKVPVDGSSRALDDASLSAVAEVAHAHGRRLVAHALSDRDALRAARIGADVLAHTPVTPLSEETVEAWRGRAVISTLVAFGSPSAVENLARLEAADVAVLYGTDLGNTRTTGIDGNELALLVRAGLDAPAIVRAATETPRRVLGLSRHGGLGVGDAASYLVYRGDVLAEPTLLARPDEVVIDGESL